MVGQVEKMMMALLLLEESVAHHHEDTHMALRWAQRGPAQEVEVVDKSDEDEGDGHVGSRGGIQGVVVAVVEV